MNSYHGLSSAQAVSCGGGCRDDQVSWLPAQEVAGICHRQASDLGQQTADRTTTVAEQPFHDRAEFAKRAVVFDDLKDRIVAEARRAAPRGAIRPWHVPCASARMQPVWSARVMWLT